MRQSKGVCELARVSPSRRPRPAVCAWLDSVRPAIWWNVLEQFIAGPANLMWRQSFLFLFPFPVGSENEAFLFSALCSPQSCLTRSLPADSLPFSERFGWKQCSVFWGAGRLWAYSWAGCPPCKWVIVLVGLQIAQSMWCKILSFYVCVYINTYIYVYRQSIPSSKTVV